VLVGSGKENTPLCDVAQPYNEHFQQLLLGGTLEVMYGNKCGVIRLEVRQENILGHYKLSTSKGEKR